MAELKTKPNEQSVDKFLNSIPDIQKKEDSFKILEIIKSITKEEPIMWGSSIIGFGTYHYKYKSGREGDWMKLGFSPRKQSLTIYIMIGFSKLEKHLAKLGKHSTGVGCLYFKKLADINMEVLKEIITISYKKISEQNA